MADEKENDSEKQKLIMQTKAKYFFEHDMPVHVKLNNDKWFNGKIVAPFTDDYFMLDERRDGLMPMFFLQIFDIEQLEGERA
jgi:hypothetical protein